MNLKSRIIIICLMAVSLAFLIYFSRGFISPYVSIKGAMKTERKVQLIGSVNKNYSAAFDDYYEFYLGDEHGDVVQVRYYGALAKNFQHSEKIVVIGRYSKEEKYFAAEKILLKCPSKYKEKAAAR